MVVCGVIGGDCFSEDQIALSNASRNCSRFENRARRSARYSRSGRLLNAIEASAGMNCKAATGKECFALIITHSYYLAQRLAHVLGPTMLSAGKFLFR